MEQKSNKKVNKIIIAISAIIIFVILIVGIFFVASYADKEKEELTNKSNTIIEMSKDKNEEGYEKITENVTEDNIVDDENQILDRSYGKIEIIWVDKKNNNITQPLKPVLNGMNAIKFNNTLNNFELTNEDDQSWFDYSTGIWANAMDENQSFFVWIPRYAYKIIYYSDKTYTKPIGYADSRGILKIGDNNTLIRIVKNNPGLKTVGNHYILHPAFMNDTASGFINGGWDDNLDGIWVSKYEASMEVNGKHTETQNPQIGNVVISDIVKAVSKPSVSSWRYISIGNCYYNAFNYNRNRESHLMKNTEWGAVAYLSYSNFGTGSKTITINSSQEYIVGDSKNPIDSFVYKKAESSNGNATGIYDLVGGAWEYVSAYINNGYYRSPVNGGTAPGFLLENNLNSKYKTIYSHNDADKGNGLYNSNDANANYLANCLRRGDSILETSTNGYGNSAWNINASLFDQQDVPFMLRGGDCASGVNAGLFSYNCSTGQANAADGFRIVLAFK